MLLVDEKKYQAQTLRPYQQEAVKAIRESWDRGESPIAALATGAGKTTIMSQLLREVCDPNQQRAVVIGHTTEIVHQLHSRIMNQFDGRLADLYTPFFKPGIGMVMAHENIPDARIVVASRQSLHENRLREVIREAPIDYCLIDEVHHALSENSYGDIIQTLREDNPDLKLAGVTATPKRTDRQALAGLFDSICYEWLIPEGISAGYLVPVTRMRVKTEVDLSKVRNTGGDYNGKKLVSALDTANWLELCVQAHKIHIAPTERPTLAFLPSVEMSRAFTDALNAAGIPAAHVDGETDKEERKDILQAYRDGAYRVITNFGVFTEGFDSPQTSAIFLGRPTRSSTLFTQIVGRGLRPFPGKTDCLLLDMTVVDTKALEQGTLLGRMVTCEECGVDFYASLTHCPQCGAPKPEKKLEEAIQEAIGLGGVPKYTGERLVTEYSPLFEKAFAAWYHGQDGFMSCTLSFEDGAYIIVPPLEDEYYRLVHVPKSKNDAVRFLERNEDLSELMLDADSKVREQASNNVDKDAPWRQAPATIAQINLLRKLGVTTTTDMSRGVASQLITHAISVQRLMRG